jgi:electron transport complex protein RnfD
MKLIVSTPPHWHGKLNVSKIHFNIILALLPAIIFAVYIFGIHAARVITLAVSVAVISEIVIQKLFKQPDTLMDGSSFLIGLLFAMLLPPSAPYWLVIIGSFLCIFIGKAIFGGLGNNPLNPALLGWAILRISWPSFLNLNLTMAQYDLDFGFQYPLTILKKGGTELISGLNLIDLIMGSQVGGIGSTAILLLFIGGLYLLIRRIIPWEIPLSFAVGVLAVSAIFYSTNDTMYANPLFHLVTGNVMLGLFFLSTDYSSSPFTRWGMIVFGLGCGILTIVLRAWSIYPDSVVFAILIMNLFTPVLDKIKSKPKSFQVFHIERGLS